MRGRILTVALTAALLTSIALPGALADGRGRSDGNDARGPLDIARISHAHRGSGSSATLVHTMRLHEAWRANKLRDRAFAVFSFDLRGRRGAGHERTVQVWYQKGALVADMFDHVGAGHYVGPVTLRRPNARTIRVSFHKSMLRKGLRSYKWRAATVVKRHGKCGGRNGCIDWAPDGRRVRDLTHRL